MPRPPAVTTDPSRTVTVRSAYAATRGSWVTTTTPACSVRAVLTSSSMTSSAATESSEPVGSSAKISRGPATSARAIATRWPWPPESSPGSRSPRPSRPSRGSHACGRRHGPPPLAGQQQRQRDVLHHWQLGHELSELEHEPERRAGAAGCAPGRAGWSTRRPSKTTSPASGVRIPARQCSRVDLPAPLGPITATTSPAPTATSAPRRAGVWPKLLCSPRPVSRAVRSLIAGSPRRACPDGRRRGRSSAGRPRCGRAGSR